VTRTQRASPADLEFRRAFEACDVAPQVFDHAAHVRLAYINLCDESVDGATERMKTALLAFLAHIGVDAGKYHETITRAWIMAVQHFITRSPNHDSAASFMAAHPELLDSRIMLTHYSAAVLFSPEARQSFVAPDIQSIPPPA
jgi:hypothetical protein